MSSGRRAFRTFSAKGSVEANKTASSRRSNWKRSSLMAQILGPILGSTLLQLGRLDLVAPRRAAQIDRREHALLPELDIAAARQLQRSGEGRGQCGAALQRRFHA